jgi:glycosyltransferase involved in cell wall biosynthesis
MANKHDYDLTYVTVDSLSEGVGWSQIVPLMKLVAKAGLSVNLISFEKDTTPSAIEDELKAANVSWNRREFKSGGAISGLGRLIEIARVIPNTRLIHARSDIPAVAASLSKKAPILWDVRSLWAEQKAFIEPDPFKRKILRMYGGLESIASFNASAMSTLTNAVVPVLEEKHKVVPKLRIIVPTAVNLETFRFNHTMTSPYKGLYSGTYNNYYDLHLSRLFIEELQKLVPVEIHWARPKESPSATLNAGETSIFAATQIEMASIVGSYNFGISICKMNAGPSLKAAMPTKIAEFLACGRPVVVNSGLGDFDQYLSEFNAGVILSGTRADTKAKAQELMNLLSDPETPYRCRALAEKYFDIREGAKKYLDLYDKM